MPSLQNLRRELKPVYGHYADAVISMIGLRASVAVFDSAKAKKLGAAHLGQVTEFFDRRPKLTRKLINVDPFHSPSWLAKPLPSLPANMPELGMEVTLGAPDRDVLTGVSFTVENQIVGEVEFEPRKINRQRVLLVYHLQQQTTGMKPREARKAEGWKNAAMVKLEKIAQQHKCSLILYRSGEPLARHNISQKPIHAEVLETYGRLPMQHGYALRHVFKSELPEHPLSGKLEPLWWIRHVE